MSHNSAHQAAERLARRIAGLPMPNNIDPRLQLEDRLRAVNFLMERDFRHEIIPGQEVEEFMQSVSEGQKWTPARWPSDRQTALVIDPPCHNWKEGEQAAILADPKGSLKCSFTVVEIARVKDQDADSHIALHSYTVNLDTGETQADDPGVMLQGEWEMLGPATARFFANLSRSERLN